MAVEVLYRLYINGTIDGDIVDIYTISGNMENTVENMNAYVEDVWPKIQAELGLEPTEVLYSIIISPNKEIMQFHKEELQQHDEDCPNADQESYELNLGDMSREEMLERIMFFNPMKNEGDYYDGELGQ